MTAGTILADWPLRHVVAGTTTRTGGVSEGHFASLNLAAHVGDDRTRVDENRRRLSTALGVSREPRWLEQVHGTTAVYADDPAFAAGPVRADAIVSREGREVLAVLTADCLPVLLCTETSAELAAMHCGWRSLAGGIIDETLALLESAPANLVAWLGPAISQPAYEVGDDVRDVFLAGIEDAAACFHENARGRWQADLCGLARRYLKRAGVERLYGGGLCTYSDSERFFSYRRDGQCGRMATFIFRARGQGA